MEIKSWGFEIPQSPNIRFVTRRLSLKPINQTFNTPKVHA